MSAGVVVAIVAAVLVGTVLQRVAGMGVGLVVAPVLAIALGPVVGVFVTNATTVVSGVLIMLSVISRVQWRQYLLFLPGVILGAVPAALLVGAIDGAWLSVLIGSVVLAALALTLATPRLPHVRTPALSLATGLIGGFLNTASGVAAPAMAIHARLTRWDQSRFAATLQPTFATMGIVSVGAKLATGTTTLAQLPPPWIFPVIVATVLCGVGLGAWLARRVPPRVARAAAFTIAGAGAVSAIVRGIAQL